MTHIGYKRWGEGISGAIAQLGERDNGIVEVGSSILPGSKNIGSYARSKNHPRRTKCA